MIYSSTLLKTIFGEFIVNYHEFSEGDCLSFVIGEIKNNIPILRVHSACLFGEVFHSLSCDCNQQLQKSLNKIRENKMGIVIYMYQEGRGIGIKNKIRAMEFERVYNIDTVQAFERLNYKSDERGYIVAAKALKELGVSRVNIITNNPKKIQELESNGISVHERTILKYNKNKLIKKYLATKKEKLNHII